MPRRGSRFSLPPWDRAGVREWAQASLAKHFSLSLGERAGARGNSALKVCSGPLLATTLSLIWAAQAANS